MDRQKEDQCNGNHTVENQYHGELIPNHTEQSAAEGDQHRSQQKPALEPQLLSVCNGMDDTQMNTGDDSRKLSPVICAKSSAAPIQAGGIL